MRPFIVAILIGLGCGGDDPEPLAYCSYTFQGETGGTTMSGMLIAVGDGEAWVGMMASDAGGVIPMSGESSNGVISFSFQVDADTTLSGSGTLDVPFGTCPASLSGTMAGGGTWEATTTTCPEATEASCRSCLDSCACETPCSALACDSCSSCIAACHSDGACAEACSPAP